MEGKSVPNIEFAELLARSKVNPIEITEII